MIFTKTSTRTRISFEVGIAQLGAQPLFLNANDIQLRVGETMKDTGHVLSRYLDAIMIRTYAQADVVDLAASATIPIINGLTDDHHPCQAMADALTIKEHCGGLEGRTLVYSGDGNNVAHSLAEVGAKTGMRVIICTPDDFRPDADIIARARADAAETGATIELTSDLRAAVKGADVIYTDTFTSMGQESEHDVRLAALRDYQVNDDAAGARRPPGARHALPAGPLGRGDHRGGALQPAVGGLRPGREPPACPEGGHGGADRLRRGGRSGVRGALRATGALGQAKAPLSAR